MASDTHTPARTVRIDDALWARAQAEARNRSETVSDAIRRFLIAYADGTDDTDRT